MAHDVNDLRSLSGEARGDWPASFRSCQEQHTMSGHQRWSPALLREAQVATWLCARSAPPREPVQPWERGHNKTSRLHVLADRRPDPAFGIYYGGSNPRVSCTRRANHCGSGRCSWQATDPPSHDLLRRSVTAVRSRSSRSIRKIERAGAPRPSPGRNAVLSRLHA